MRKKSLKWTNEAENTKEALNTPRYMSEQTHQRSESRFTAERRYAVMDKRPIGSSLGTNGNTDSFLRIMLFPHYRFTF